MYITDANGNTGFILARMWDGERWVIVPERIFKDRFWWVINYFSVMFASSIQYSFNVDNNIALRAEIINSPLFNHPNVPT